MSNIDEKIKELLSFKWTTVNVLEADDFILFNLVDPINKDAIPLDNAWTRHKARIKRNPNFYNKK